MLDRKRWVARHGSLLVIAVALVGGAYASWLDEACVGSGDASESVALDEERIAIPTEGLPHKGAGFGARVTMIECSDFECPYSKRASATVDELLAHNDDLAFFHVHFPLGMFEHSRLEANASVAAQRQGRFWEMHDALFAASIDSEAAAIDLAGRLGLDVERFAADLRSAAARAEVDRQHALCKNAGVRGVPTFFINGRRVVGSIPAGQFQRIIDEERR
jgi:protein-disulfide isomerase